MSKVLIESHRKAFMVFTYYIIFLEEKGIILDVQC